ncbi:prepilin-type N-terminal cleavage/methylation domain-containing protein [Arthrobacter sp. UYCo732]|uniref:prepilin-type N-terminal cleavage/methylation domain-containing protein n=1 Tax=Arthrobacter sp. UYCo732 TaxID=3156336 RepID=UPI003391600B
MSNIARLLDPQEARARMVRGEISSPVRKKRRDAGFSLIEIMAGMAIIAILALAILPQFSKYFERAAVQNLSGTVSDVALTVESDYSLSGKAKYVAANVTASIAASNLGAAAVTSTIDANGYGYVLKATSPDVTNYCVKYTSQGTAAGLSVTPKATPATVCP